LRGTAGKQQLQPGFGGRGSRGTGSKSGAEFCGWLLQRLFFLSWYLRTAALCSLIVVEN
jgi:hypothetical protein